MTLATRITGLILLLLAIIVGIFAATLVLTNAQKHDNLVLNLSARQRMLSQKIAEETLFSLGNGKGADEAKDQANKTVQVFDKTLEALKQGGTAPLTLDPNGSRVKLPMAEDDVLQQLERVTAAWTPYKNSVLAALDDPLKAEMDEIVLQSRSVLEEMNTAVNLMQLHAEEKIQMLIYVQVATTLTALLAGILLLLSFRRSLLAPLHRIQSYAGEIARGKLDTELKGSFKAELAELKDSLISMFDALQNNMHEAVQKSRDAQEKTAEAKAALKKVRREEDKTTELMNAMKDIAGRAKNLSSQVNNALDQVTDRVEDAVKGVEVQRTRVSETAVAMEEMNGTVMEVAKNASDAAGNAEESRQRAQEGSEGVNKAVTSIRNIEERIDSLKDSMNELGEKADSIGQIMDVINEIADQTNLLALNAAIEAARAGEAGRGFAVVADEVRKLAEKTMSATSEVGAAIAGIQEKTRENAQAVEMAAEDILQSTQAATESGRMMEEIVTLVAGTSGMVDSIATASEEQSSTSEEINRALSEINTIAEDTAKGMERAAEAITEIVGLVEEMDIVVTSLTGEGADVLAQAASNGELFVWTDELSVGIEKIDKQHKHLVELINRLHHAMVNHETDDVIRGVLDELKEYVVEHFGYEEELFDAYGYPETEEHKANHKDFVAKVLDFDEDLKSGQVTLSMDIMRFLKNWLITHIMKTDKRYGPFLNEHGVK